MTNISFTTDIKLTISHPRITPGFDDSGFGRNISSLKDLPKKEKIVPKFSAEKKEEEPEAFAKVQELIDKYSKVEEAGEQALELIRNRLKRFNHKVPIDRENTALIDALGSIYGSIPEFMTYDMYVDILDHSFELSEALADLNDETRGIV